MTVKIATTTSDSADADVLAMADEVVRMLKFTRESFSHLDAAPLEDATRLGRQLHRQERGFVEHMMDRSGAARDELVFVPMHLERIADNIELLAGSIGKLLVDGVLFTDRARRETRALLDAAVELLEGLRDALRTGNRTLVRYVLETGRSVEARANDYALFHEQRLIEGVCLPRSSSVYLAVLDQLKGIEWHARQIASKLQNAPRDGAGVEADAGHQAR
jgi:Na+/phosphate symporter